MSNIKAVIAALNKKIADLDMIDDQISDLPEMAPDADMEMSGPTSPELSLLSDKREELEEEIRQMQEGVQLITEWEKFKGGQWSEEIKNMLSEIDVEITDIAGGESAPAGDLLDGPDAPDMAPAPDMEAPAPDMAPAPDALEEPSLEGDDLAPEAPIEEPAPVAAPIASAKKSSEDCPACQGTGMRPGAKYIKGREDEDVCPVCKGSTRKYTRPQDRPNPYMASTKTPVSKKNNYQSPDKKDISPSNLKKEGYTMANETSKPSIKDKLAEVKSKREAIKKEAQQRVAAAWTIAKTMLPTAPAEIQKNAAATLLQNSTPVLNAMLRQTAKNSHYNKVAETFKSVHKVEMNDLLEDPSILSGERKSVESEIKGDAKSAANKVADDRKECGPITGEYNDGRKGSEPKEMDGNNAAKRPANTINMSEGGDKVAAKKKGNTCRCGKPSGDKCFCSYKCKGEAEGNPDAYAEGTESRKLMEDLGEKQKQSKKKCEDCKGDKKCKKHCASAKKADESAVMQEEEMPAEGEGMDMPPEEGEEGIEPPSDMPPEEEVPEEDTAEEVMSDEKKMLVEEKIEEAQEAISSLEREILEESAEGEELDYSQIFNEGEGEAEGPVEVEGEVEGQELNMQDAFDEDEMAEKVSSFANEGDEHTAAEGGYGEEFFAPSKAADMEDDIEGHQFASMEDFFSLKGSDSDPLARLMASDIRTAADVAGVSVIPSSTGEAAKHFISDEATGESRDTDSDHEGDLFAEAIDAAGEPENSGHKRIPQDSTNKLEEPKSATKKTAAIKKLKPVVASTAKPFDAASALFGNDEF